MGCHADRARSGTCGRCALIRVASLQASDYAAWRRAYGAYADVVASPIDDSIAARLWEWIRTREYGLLGFGVFDSEELVGFAHVRPFPRTLDGNEAGFLDDLYVVPAYRGTPAVRTLFEHIAAIACDRGWTHVRWVTSDDNAHARRLYEKIARPVDVRTYRLDTSDRR